MLPHEPMDFGAQYRGTSLGVYLHKAREHSRESTNFFWSIFANWGRSWIYRDEFEHPFERRGNCAVSGRVCRKYAEVFAT